MRTTTYTAPAVPSGWYRFNRTTQTPCRRCYTAICRIEGPLQGFVRGNCYGCGRELPGFFYDTDVLLDAWEEWNTP